jgi:hypothetical protein
VLSPALGGCFIPASNAVLHASLSSAFFSLRQVVISSALGLNALQSLNASGVHAKRCSSVPCEKEGAGEVVADSKASDTHHCAEDVSRSIIHLFFLRSSEDLPSVIEVDTRHHHGRYNYPLAGARACSETSAFVAFDPAAVLPLPKEGGASSRYARLSGSVDFAIDSGCAQTTKSSHVGPSVGNGTIANVSC